MRRWTLLRRSALYSARDFLLVFPKPLEAIWFICGKFLCFQIWDAQDGDYNVTSCSLVEMHRRFRAVCCLQYPWWYHSLRFYADVHTNWCTFDRPAYTCRVRSFSPLFPSREPGNHDIVSIVTRLRVERCGVRIPPEDKRFLSSKDSPGIPGFTEPPTSWMVPSLPLGAMRRRAWG
jgi:hypothetical protein